MLQAHRYSECAVKLIHSPTHSRLQ